MTIEALEWLKNNRPELTAREELDEWCGVKDCQQPQLDRMPLCEDHAFEIWIEIGARRMDIFKAAMAHQRRESKDQELSRLVREKVSFANATAERLENTKQAPGIIYYLQIEDRVKIGFTSDFETRLRAYPPMAKLLATHPGTRETEKLMHRKFSDHLADRKEWFRNHEDIQLHLTNVRKQFKQDPRAAA